MKKTKRIILAVLGLLLLITPKSASAGLISTITAGAVSWLVSGMGYIVAFTIGWFFSLAGILTGLTLKLNEQVLSHNQVVAVGWGITRDLANLGFVIVIVVIAIATIVRWQTYGYQKLLPKLIAAAIIVNFSLAIAGAFINFSHLLGNYFWEAVSPGGWRDNVALSKTIGGAFAVQKLTIPDLAEEDMSPYAREGDVSLPGEAGVLGYTMLVGIASLVFMAVFMAIATFTMLVFAILLLIRYLFLTFLLVLAPLAWLFWVFPALSSLFSKWWHEFIKWTFFLPASAFFMYLAIKSVTALEEVRSAGVDVSQAFEGGVMVTLVETGLQMIVIAGVMLGGLLVAQKLSITGANIGVNYAKAGGKAVGKWAGKGTAVMGRRALGAGVDKETGKTWLERKGAQYGKVPLLGRLATGVSGLSTRSKTALKSQLEGKKKAYAERTGEDAAAIASRRAMPDTDSAAAGLRAAEMGKWEDISPEGRERVKAALKRMNAGDQLLSHKPSLAKEFEFTVEQAMARFVQDASKLHPDEFENDEVTRYLRNANISQLGNTGTLEHRSNVVKSLETQLGEAAINEFTSRTNTMEAAKFSGDKTKIEAAKREMKTFKDGLTKLDKEKRAALERYERILGEANWQDALSQETPQTPAGGPTVEGYQRY